MLCVACGGQRKGEAPKAALDPVVAQAEAQIRRASQPEWDLLRGVVVSLGSDEGVLKLFRSNPALAGASREADFLALVKAHRTYLEPLPVELGPDQAHHFELQKAQPGRARLRYDWPSGLSLELDLDGQVILGLRLMRKPNP